MHNVWFLGMTLDVMLEIAALLLIPPLLVSGTVYVDRRSGRGYGLAALALALLVLVIWAAATFVELQRNARFDLLGSGIALAIFLGTGLYLTLVLSIGSLIQASRAHQASWFAGLLVVEVIPWLVVLIQALSRKPVPSLPAMFGLTSEASVILMLLLPALVTLVYGLVRCVRPVQPAATRQAAPAW